MFRMYHNGRALWGSRASGRRERSASLLTAGRLPHICSRAEGSRVPQVHVKPGAKSRFAVFRAGLADRLARSSRVFLLTLIVLLGIEILVDWNQTLVEINVLRDQIRLKGVSYAGLLARAAVEPMVAGDQRALVRLASGILDDEDAIYIRITDPRGRLIFDQIDAEFAKQEAAQGRAPFPQRYAHFLSRDALGVSQDFEGFRLRLINSRYRDLPQIWSDFINQLAARFSPPPSPPASRARILYQDRLRDAQRRRDDSTTWAITPVEYEGEAAGAILVAFDMARTNRAVRNKYIKGLAIVLFFVALIVFQNVVGRRDKLRLLDLEQRYARAKSALRAALPVQPLQALSGTDLQVLCALDQARGHVDGLVWDIADDGQALWLLAVDPDGDGIDAAAIGLHVLATFRKRRQAGMPLDLEREIRALGAATREIPLTRPIGVLLVRVEHSGAFFGLHSEFVRLCLADLQAGVRSSATKAVQGELAFTDEQSSSERDATESRDEASLPYSPVGVVGPLFRVEGTLAQGETLICAAVGRGERQARIDVDAIARYMIRSRGAAGLRIEDVATWARGKHVGLAENDLLILTVQRSAATA